MTSGDGSPEKEYDQIEQDRRAWAENNAARDRLFLPLAIGVFAFLGSQMPQFIRLGIEWFAFLTGGLLVLVLLGYWRWMVLGLHPYEWTDRARRVWRSWPSFC